MKILKTYLMSRAMRIPVFGYARTKTQISCAVMKLICAFVFVTLIVKFLYFLNVKPLAILCCCTARFVSDLVGNPQDKVSHDAAQL